MFRLIQIDLSPLSLYSKHCEGRPSTERRLIWDVKSQRPFQVYDFVTGCGILKKRYRVSGYLRVREPTISKEARQYLIYRLEQIRLAEIYGVRPKRTFKEAAAKYLAENQHKRTIEEDMGYIEQLKPYYRAM